MKTIELTPTREGYIIMLKAIIEGTLNRGFDPDDATWAKEELAKLGEQPEQTATWVYAFDNEEGEKK